MSFGYSIGDAILLTQLAWTVVRISRRACGEHEELTREVLSLHVVLQRLEHEVAKPESPINRPGDMCREELEVVASGCQWVLKILDQILEKYNTLSDTERSGRRLWQKIKFGNGKMTDLADLRSKLTFYTSALSFFLNMVSLGMIGRVEQQMIDAGGDLKEIRLAVNGITAQLMTRSSHEGSVLTAYPDDDKAVWKEFRRELVAEGFSSSVIRKHKYLIKAYVRELGARGLLDEAETQVIDGPSTHSRSVLEETSRLTTLRDPGTAEPQSSTMPAAETYECPYVQISPDTSTDPLPALEVQSNTTLDSGLDIESKVQLRVKGVVDIQGVTPLGDTQKYSVLTSDTERPQQLRCRENPGVERPDANYSTASSYVGVQTDCAYISSAYSGEELKASTPNSRGAVVGAEAAIQAITSFNKDYDSPQGNAYSNSPAEMIKVASDAWYNEYLSTLQYSNISPSLSAKKVLRNLLIKLNAVDLEAIGWSNELKAYRTCLIEQINSRLYTMARRTQTPRKHHICRPRCFCKSDASDNAESIKDPRKHSETLLDPARGTHDGAPLKNTSSRLGTARRLESPGVLHRIWHDHHDRVAPLCLEWVELWGRRVWEQGRVQKVLQMNTEYMKLITCIRKNKERSETLDLGGDAELTARGEELTEDMKMMVSSLRIFKSDNKWTWATSGVYLRGVGLRVCLDISWVKGTITSCMGTKCGICSAS